MKRVIHLLPIALILASSSALAGWQWHGPGQGYGECYGYGCPYGDEPDEVLGGAGAELDPADSRTTSDDFPGAAEDSPGRGEWGPSEAGNQQPGNGAPYSGPRPR